MISRREFLIASSVASIATPFSASLARLGPIGANDRIRVGMIGFGIRGSQLVRNVYAEPNVEVVAASDLYEGHLARALELAEGHSAPMTTKRYEQILDNKDIDAVVVAVPDFWHKKVVVDALSAGKHVYCEKPLMHRLEDGPVFVSAVEKSGRIFQVGSQHVSSPHVIEAKKLIASGELGQITQVKATWDTNTPISAWQMPIPSDASTKTIDWDRWQEPAVNKVPFEPQRFFSWRRYNEYGESLAGDVLVHIITTIHYLLGIPAAPPLVTAVGGRFRWHQGPGDAIWGKWNGPDDRDAYDSITITTRYPEGLVANYEANQDNQFLGQHMYILGSKATMDLTFGDYKVYAEEWPQRWSYAVESWARPERERFYAANGGAPQPMNPAAMRAAFAPTAPKPILQSQPMSPSNFARGYSPHMEAFIQAIRTGTQPAEDVHLGVEAATTALLGNMSYQRQQAIHWDDKNRSMTTAAAG